MLSGVRSASDTARITYTGPIAAAALTPGDFEATHVSEFGISIAQVSAAVIDIVFASGIDSDDNVVYTGATSGVLTPDMVDLVP